MEFNFTLLDVFPYSKGGVKKMKLVSYCDLGFLQPFFVPYNDEYYSLRGSNITDMIRPYYDNKINKLDFIINSQKKGE